MTLSRPAYNFYADILSLPAALGPLDRERLAPPWASDAMIATDTARMRFRRWHAAGEPDAEPEDALAFAGDDAMRDAVVNVLRRLPQCARHHVATTALVVAIGRTAAGVWQTAPKLPTNNNNEPLGLIAIAHDPDESELAAVIAHECAHSWLSPPGVPCDAREATESRAVRACYLRLGAQIGRLDDVAAPLQRDERLASRLAGAWGFTGRAADPDRNAQLVRRRVWRDAEITG